MSASDPFEGIEARTAAKLTQLCTLRGIAARVTWDGTRYLANNDPCGPSVHGVYEWMEKQTKSALEILDRSPGGRPTPTATRTGLGEERRSE